MYKFSTLATSLFLGFFATAQTKHVLFIGNSYTSVNNLPLATKNLALSLEDTLIVDSNTPGGTTFNYHSTNATSLTKIRQGNWDYVVLQAQSQEPSFPPAQVSSQTYPFAAKLVDSILAYNECAVLMFYMTWGRQNGDASNCANYAPLCTYDGMQTRLRESYLEMAADNQSEVSPVGAAWKYVRDNHPTINLYSADESHPSVEGTYLAACVHYAAIFKKSPVGATYLSSLNATNAAILQNAAKLVVLDSTEKWNFGVRDTKSEFDFVNSGSTFDFSNSSVNATDYLWDFGDGNTSALENPSHTYGSFGSYNVVLRAFNNCDADTMTTTVSFSTENVDDFDVNGFEVVIKPNFLLLKCDQSINATVQLLSIDGKIIATQSWNGTTIELPTPKVSGVYLLLIKDSITQVSVSRKVFVP